jgi:predicted CXXCH cytochrome family protein
MQGQQRKLAAKACTDCHQPVLQELSKKVVHAPFRNTAGCDTCHKRHGIVGTLVLQKEEPALCYGCHQKQQDAFKAAHVHVPVAQGKCTRCHNPHSSDSRALLRSEGNLLCFTCHDRKKFTQASVHKPAGESCLTCHDAHAGANERRLTKPVAELCVSCHKTTSHNGFKVDKNCTNCHTPHSSAEKGLLRAVAHPPISDCTTCHTGQPIKQPDLCLTCHDIKPEKTVHEPFKSGDCTTCHSPHASDDKGLLNEPQKTLCLTCHDLGGQITHKPAADGKCTSCHSPHTTATPKLLKAEGQALCDQCHADKTKAWNAEKNVHAALAAGCDSCHKPHGGVQMACFTCHEDKKPEFTRRFVHAPVRDNQCAACHSPHASSNEKLLKTTPDKLCVTCHQSLLTSRGEHAHAPVASGDCQTCHAPHSTDRPMLLKDDMQNLCGTCHDDVGKSMTGAKSVHPPALAGSCTSCHDAHGSPETAFLKGNPKLVCLGCHTGLSERMRRGGVRVHAPVAEGKCTACHNGHASAESALLRKPVSQLCADCHKTDTEIMQKAHSNYSLTKADCTTCHDPHMSSKKGLFNPYGHNPFVDGDCSACHVPAEKPGSPATLNAKGFELCETCHGDFPEKYRKGQWVHAPAKAGECLSCHTPHAGRARHLIQRVGPSLCTDCHPTIAKDLIQPVVHQPVKKGKCVSCHSPHASDNAKGLLKKGEDLCFTCHDGMKKLKSAISVHPPFAGGDCDTCHAPHASANGNLLVDNPNALCRTCHDPASHKKFPLPIHDCTSCHNPHASNQAHLIRSKPHQVFTPTSCARCHDGKPIKTPTELCYRCHSPIKALAQKPGAHKALESGCTTCHNPHTADEPGLIKNNNERAICLGCHKNIREQMDHSVSIHPLKANGGRCTSCHEPHQSGKAHLLKGDINAVCSKCHGGHAQFGHPVGSNVIDPRTNQGMNCLSCHSPHGSQNRMLLRADPQRALCIECHAANDAMGVAHAQ